MKNYCKYCGEQLQPDLSHNCKKRPIRNFICGIGAFFKNILEKTGCGDSKDTDYYERGKPIVPESIVSDNGEIPVKQYDLAILRSRAKFTKAEGRMQITNKRLLFRASGRSPLGKTIYQHEFALDKIDGIEIRKDYRFRVGDLFGNSILASLCTVPMYFLLKKLNESYSIWFGVLCAVIGATLLVPFFAVYKKYLAKLISTSFATIIIAEACDVFEAQGLYFPLTMLDILLLMSVLIMYISLFLSCFKANLSVEVKTGGTPAVQIKHKYSSFFVWKKMEEYSGFAEILPGKDADAAINEIGAIIDDIKTLGDMGIEKWEKNEHKKGSQQPRGEML